MTTDQGPKQVNNVIPLARDLLSTGSSEPLQTGKLERLPQPLLDKLWTKMTEMYGHRWTASVGDSADQDHAWASVLRGLTGKQIAAGLNNLVAKAQDWPPSAPEFRRMCTHVPGLPTESEAWMQALRGQYTHEAVQVAAHLTGTFDLRKANATDGYLKQQFERNYAIVMRRIQNGQPLYGRVHAGIGHDSNKTEAERANDLAEMQLQARLEQQGVPPGKSARELLLAKMGINRGESRA